MWTICFFKVGSIKFQEHVATLREVLQNENQAEELLQKADVCNTTAHYIALHKDDEAEVEQLQREALKLYGEAEKLVFFFSKQQQKGAYF